MDIRTNSTRPSQFVWIFGSFLFSPKEIRVSREGLFCSGTETRGDSPLFAGPGTESLHFGIRPGLLVLVPSRPIFGMVSDSGHFPTICTTFGRWAFQTTVFPRLQLIQ